MYEKEILAVYRFAGIKSFPVDLTAITEAVGYRIRTYQEVAESREQLIRMKKISGDAYVIRKNKTIYINDDVPYPGRKRFSIAHELGHIILVTDDEDTVNIFASNLLAPRPIIFARQLNSTGRIAQTFGISMSAAVNAAISAYYVPDEKGFELIDYFGERYSCPWPHNRTFPVAKPVARTVPASAPGLKQETPSSAAPLDPEQKERYEAMRKRNAKARKKIQRQLAKKQKQIEFLMENDEAYRKAHTIF